MRMSNVFNLTGKLTRETVSRGSKSERDVMVLSTTEGASCTLRLAAQNPFQIAPELLALEGQVVTISEGRLIGGNTLLVDSLSRIAPRP